MAITFEALEGILSLRIGGWLSGLREFASIDPGTDIFVVNYDDGVFYGIFCAPCCELWAEHGEKSLPKFTATAENFSVMAKKQ